MGVLAGFSFAFCHFSSLALFAFSFFSIFQHKFDLHIDFVT